MTGLSMAEQQQGEQRMRAFVPLLPVMVSTFFVVALIWYRLQVLPNYTSTFEGNWLASSVAWLHASVGFLPAFLTAVLGLAWSSLWFFTGPIDRPRARVGYLVVFAICLSIVEGVGAERSTTIGGLVASRLEYVFGSFLTALLAISASLFAFLLASDFCFFRYFEGFGFLERSRPATQTKISDVEIETAAVSELMARPASVDGATPPADHESGGVAVAEPPAAPETEEAEAVDEEAAELEEAASRAQEYVEEHGFDDPLAVDGLDSEIGTVTTEEDATEASTSAAEVAEPVAGTDAPGEEELDSLFGELDDWTPPEPGSESMAGEFEEGVPTIVDVGLSSVEIPIATDDAAPDIGVTDEIESGEPVASTDEAPAADPADSVDDLSASVALREAGFLGQNTDEEDRDLSESIERDELQALIGAADSLGLDDASEAEAEEAPSAELDVEETPLGETSTDEVESDEAESGELVSEESAAPEFTQELEPELAPDAQSGWLFPSAAEDEPVEEAELVDEEFDDLVSEAESLAREVHELASRSIESPVEPESEELGTDLEAETSFDFDRNESTESGRFESTEAESAPAQGALFAPVTDDDLIAEAEELVRSTGRASVGLLARRLRIEFEHADTVLARLEERGVVAIDDETGRVSVLGD